MANYYEIGSQMILESSEGAIKYLEEIKDLERKGYRGKRFREIDSMANYHHFFIFELALRRIGENPMAEKFRDYKPGIEDTVKRVDDSVSLLPTILAHLERGNLEEARKMEEMQRVLFHIEGLGYADPHLLACSRSDEEFIGYKNELRRLLIDEKVRYSDIPDGMPKGFLSIRESVRALYANLALGDKTHAEKLLQELIQFYQNKTGLIQDPWRELGQMEQTSAITRALHIIGDGRAGKLYKKTISMMAHKAKEEARNPYSFMCEYPYMTSLCFLLDAVGEEENLKTVRRTLAEKWRDAVKKSKEHLSANDYIKEHYQTICEIGLALTGLEKGKINWLYAA